MGTNTDLICRVKSEFPSSLMSSSFTLPEDLKVWVPQLGSQQPWFSAIFCTFAAMLMRNSLMFPVCLITKHKSCCDQRTNSSSITSYTQLCKTLCFSREYKGIPNLKVQTSAARNRSVFTEHWGVKPALLSSTFPPFCTAYTSADRQD